MPHRLLSGETIPTSRNRLQAACLIDDMAEDGIVGDDNGSQAREVLYNLEQWEAIKAARVPMDAAV
ncbi:MAG TPA: hypothetical protein VK137_06180 [Planctomycetaceae bacterium]|nr:hypothetical protein [Planctomycetaceae bacterium]